MTDPCYSHFILIIDRSGSMGVIRDATEQGIRRYTEEMHALLQPGDRATLSLYQFDNVHDTVCVFTPLQDVKPYTLAPRNTTALLDAIGFAVTSEGEALAALSEDERPGKVVTVIATDGLENSSKERTRPRVRELLTQQQDAYGWQVTYIGANQDAFAEGRSIGVAHDRSMSYAGDSAHTESAWHGVAVASARYVSGQAASLAYSPAEQAAAGEDGAE